MEKSRDPTNQSRPNSIAICSPYLKEIYLSDWWLIKFSESGRIGVAGFTFKESQDARISHSAAISERFDTVTLKAMDGILIVISGCINNSRTIANGFPIEVCKHFSIGFPHYWEEVVGQSFEQSKQRYALPKISFNDLPATFLRDFCFPEIYTTTNDLPVEIPQKMGSVSSRRSKNSASSASNGLGNAAPKSGKRKDELDQGEV